MKEFAPFLDERLHIGWDDRMGHCVFTRGEIRSQEFVEIAPVIDFLPACQVDDNLMRYVIAWQDRLAVPLGWTMIYNHSDNNNCAFSMNFHDKLIAIMALRDIKAGEQITVNYGPDWFPSRGMDKIAT